MINNESVNFTKEALTASFAFLHPLGFINSYQLNKHPRCYGVTYKNTKP
jgi:hypothetical protein